MKKGIKILAFIAAGIVGLSVMAVLLCLVFRVPLMELLYGSGQYAFVLPAGSAVTLVAQLGVTVWLCICAGDRRFGTVWEVVCAAILGIGIPLVSRVLSWLQNLLTARLGAEAVMALSYTTQLWSLATGLISAASAIALFVCGMSFVYKRMSENARIS